VSSYSDANHPATLFSQAAYNAPGQLTSAHLDDGIITETRAYNSRLRMTSLAASSVYSLSISSYAPDGDVLGVTDSANGIWTYAYDAFNRLSSSSCSSHCPDGESTQGFSYSYDRFGNRWNQTLTAGSGGTLDLTFTGNNNQMDGYSYDAAGNLMSDGSHMYFYDAEHHLVQVDGSEGYCQSGTGTAPTACYTYDAEGRRVRRTVPGSGITDDYLYDLSGRFITQVSGTGFWIRGELYAGNRHLGTYENDLSTPTTFFNDTDWLGTERVQTGVSGAACETIVSLPFGDGLTTSGSCDPSALYFTSKERDWESNLDDFEARFYSSQFGRFISVDPVKVTPGRMQDPQQFNLYSYVRNNPLRYIDPDGEILQISGDVDDAEQQLCQLIGGDCSRISYNADTNTITVNLNGINLAQNEGASLLSDVVNSNNVYNLDLGSSMLTAGGLRSLSGDDSVENLDNKTDWRYGKGKSGKDKPAAGIDDQIGINPQEAVFRDSKGNLVPLSSLIFHELAEAYAKVDEGKQYVNKNGSLGAHEAVKREMKLRSQRPNMQLQGRAGDNLIREPKPPQQQ
jgi:RHS repeat-associated protein